MGFTYNGIHSSSMGIRARLTDWRFIPAVAEQLNIEAQALQDTLWFSGFLLSAIECLLKFSCEVNESIRSIDDVRICFKSSDFIFSIKSSHNVLL